VNLCKIPNGFRSSLHPVTEESIQPVRFSRVALTDAFWKPKIATNAAVTIPLVAARDEWRGLNGNVLEAAILSLETHPNPALQASVEG
jgi:hypothetical protein